MTKKTNPICWIIDAEQFPKTILLIHMSDLGIGVALIWEHANTSQLCYTQELKSLERTMMF